MKHYQKLGCLFALILLFWPSPIKAELWEKVVENGFDNPRNDYAWSMETFKGRLLVGTLNLLNGGEIWSTQSGNLNEWEKVFEAPLRSDYGIRCLYSDRGQVLYAGTLNTRGAQILRSTDGFTWGEVASGGLGNRQNTTIRCMARFGDYLYAGVGGDKAKLYRSKDGLAWEIIDEKPSFESTKVPHPNRRYQQVTNNIMIGELAVFKGYLYAFTWTKDLDIRSFRMILSRSMRQGYQSNILNDIQENAYSSDLSFMPSAAGAFEVWRSADGENWEKVVGLDDKYGNGMGFSGFDPDNMDNDVITSVTLFKDQLYLGTEHDHGKTSIWRTSDGTRWEKVLDFYELGEKYNYYIWRMIEFDRQLFIGTWNMGSKNTEGVTGAQIWISDTGNHGSFRCIVDNGFDGQTVSLTRVSGIPKNYGIRSFGILNDTLYAGTATVLGIPMRGSARQGGLVVGSEVGCEVWRMIPGK